MFDDPKKELHRLDSELRAESYEDELEQLVNQKLPPMDDLFSDLDDDWLADTNALLFESDTPRPDPTPSRKRRGDAEDFHRMAYADEELDEDAAVFVEKPAKSRKTKKEKADKQSKGVGCLPYIIFVELLGISGMLWWWFRWLH